MIEFNPDNFNNNNPDDENEEEQPYDPDAFENSDEFIALEEEMRELVRKSQGDDRNLTEKEILRRNTIYQILRPRDDDAN